MTTYNFDREIDRKKTNSLKYDFAVERGRDVDVDRKASCRERV